MSKNEQNQLAAKFLELATKGELQGYPYDEDDALDVGSKSSTTIEQFQETLTVDQTHRCSGECGRILPITSFPKIKKKKSTVRLGECRRCRDDRYGDSVKS